MGFAAQNPCGQGLRPRHPGGKRRKIGPTPLAVCYGSMRTPSKKPTALGGWQKDLDRSHCAAGLLPFAPHSLRMAVSVGLSAARSRFVRGGSPLTSCSLSNVAGDTPAVVVARWRTTTCMCGLALKVPGPNMRNTSSAAGASRRRSTARSASTSAGICRLGPRDQRRVFFRQPMNMSGRMGMRIGSLSWPCR